MAVVTFNLGEGKKGKIRGSRCHNKQVPPFFNCKYNYVICLLFHIILNCSMLTLQ